MDSKTPTPSAHTPAPTPTKLILTCIPFDGFYESFSAERVEEALGLSDVDYENWTDDNPQAEGETKEAYRARRDDHFDKLRDKADYKGMQIEYCKAYIDAFAKDNGLKLEFESLDSPRYYNFSTDRIFCFIHPEEVRRLVSIVDRKELAALIKENFTSHDGFSSSYNNMLEEWNIDNVGELDHNQIETIIECVTAKHRAEEGENYPYVLMLMENFYR